jgi:quercetin dioxygenase-like cupin family protein
MTVHNWSAIPEERLNPHLTRQAIHTAGMTIARIGIASGAAVPEHSHPNEQVSMVERGALRFLFGGEARVVRAGEMVLIPSAVPHSVEALEDSVAIDLFTPRREDWIRGDDAYLRK